MNFNWFRFAIVLALLPCFIGIVGCGGRPSTEDLIMRAAQRKRPKDQDIDDEDKLPAKKSPAVAEEVAKADPAEAPAEDVAPAAAPPKVETITVKPIEQRKPNAPLSEEKRREMAYENLTKIGEAIDKYYVEHKLLPARFSKTKSGIATLSWRVELLPYLGYEELHKQFDFNKPWNLEPNKSLLQYIPRRVRFAGTV